MRTPKLILASLLLVLVASSQAQAGQRSVLLPASEAAQVGSKSSWQPTTADIESLEANLSHISDLQARGWKPAQHIDHPEKYFRQYVAVVANDGKRKIFINAFCNAPPSPDWHTHLLLTADGGSCYWHATYDPVTKKYSGLEINGVG
jgi:hypothetical protein